MKQLLTALLLSFTFISFSQTSSTNNEKAEIVKEYITKNKVNEVEITYKKVLFKKREIYSNWSFPGGNFIAVDGRLYNLDYLQYFEALMLNASFKNESTILILNFDKIR